ncbi:MAG: DUF1178 family protein [Sphingomonadales bacterium]
MIVFDLSCAQGHVFEAWFGDSADFADQKKRKLLSCPICNDDRVDKAPMAPRLNMGASAAPLTESGEQKSPSRSAMAAPMSKEAMALLGKIQRHVEDNFDYVGDRFAEEARAMHEGESEQRGIYGEATLEEGKALYEEGIAVMPMPMPAKPRRGNA